MTAAAQSSGQRVEIKHISAEEYIRDIDKDIKKE